MSDVSAVVVAVGSVVLFLLSYCCLSVAIEVACFFFFFKFCGITVHWSTHALDDNRVQEFICAAVEKNCCARVLVSSCDMTVGCV